MRGFRQVRSTTSCGMPRSSISPRRRSTGCCAKIVGLLGPDGILSGYTLTEAADGRKSNALHEYEFKDKEDLRRFFIPHFKFVKVWETIYPTRHNLYFVASQTPVEVFA